MSTVFSSDSFYLICGVIAVVAIVLGYLFATIKYKHAQAQLTAQLQHEQQQLQRLQPQLEHYQTAIKQHEQALQQAALAESKLQEQYHFSQLTVQRLEQDVRQYKADLQQQQQLSEQGRLKLFEAEKQLQVQLNQLQNEYTRLQTELHERTASHQRELDNFAAQKASLAEQFKVLSNDILEVKAQSLQESSKLSFNAMMMPFQQSIDNFKKEVQDIHHRETTQQGELKKELESLKALNQQITQEAHALSTALRGQKKLQGNWGELVLENVLDRSGLQLGKDYQREVSFTTEEGKFRPDAVVYLPQNKHLVIDAKVSLNAYTRYVNAESESERVTALKEHIQAVASRIKELSAKDYYRLPGLNSPDMVFMFIPIESAFVEALKADETLFQQAIENNILVATPTTLLTSLNIVRQLWRYEDQNKHTAALADRAEQVFKKLNSFLGSFEKIKKGLDTAGAAYVAAENQLVSGRGNLVKQVADFKSLAPAIRSELPQYFTEKAELEIDFVVAAEQDDDKAETEQ